MKYQPLRKALFFVIANSLLHIAHCQSLYWQQQVNYIIDVSLNDKEKTLDGFEKLAYLNNSPDTLRYIWFHLWPNAYKNDHTAFSDHLLENGNTKFYFSSKDQKGYINRLDFKVNGVAAKTEDHPQHIDIIKLLLPAPVPPQQQITITTPFHVKLPFNFSRGGYDKESFQLTQWYPKPAVYDEKGWHPMPYLDQGEFYSEFGNYDVRISVPADYVVAATGELQNTEERKWLETRKINSTQVKKTAIKKPGTPDKKKNLNTNPTLSSKTKTLQYLQNNVHDFAFFADKDFIVEKDTCQLPSGKIIDVQTYYTPPNQINWKQSLQYVKDAARFYSAEVGEYPYNIITAVQGPESFGGGMEYPTITVISPSISGRQFDRTIAHEVGHNWFYGILASNEREHPWMDEGINSFYENKYLERKYGPQTKEQEIAFQTLAKKHKDQPIETTSTAFNTINFGLVAYHKTAQWLKNLEDKLGAQKFREMMQQYFVNWNFKHPQPKDFKFVVDQYLQNNTSAFEQLTEKGILHGQHLSGFKLITPFQPKTFKQYLRHPTKNALIVSPAMGFNSYDKFMIGGLFSNYKFPPSAFQFVAVPLYGTGSKKMNGIGKLGYTAYPIQGWLQKAEVFINASKFSINDFTDSKNNRFVFGFHKLVPGVEISFKEKDIKSTSQKYIQWKSFFLKEEPLRISFDTLITGNDTTINDVVTKDNLHFSIHQLEVGIRNHRALYPFSAVLTGQGSANFFRLNFEGTYFFNYPKGGLQVRLFAGKLFYDENKKYEYGYNINRFFLNMSGANGEEDFTYSNYFVGRNEFEGLASQQLIIRDGGFKIRSDLLASKIGKTDNWLAAINLNSTIPSKINPLSILPFKIPLRVFADIGTYADAWKEGAETDRFLFDAGFHIPLFNEIINIYFPIIYSKAYSDYVKSIYTKNKVLKTMSFTISLDKTLKAVNQLLSF